MRYKFRLSTFLFFILLLSTVIISCDKDEEDPRVDSEKITLKNYITEQNITTTPKESGLYYIETQAGSGRNAKMGDRVTVHYTGKFLNGEVFETTLQTNSPFSFMLGTGYVIKGWDEGVTYMKKGGKATLIIPSNLGYGDRTVGNIPPYTTLIFEIQLVNID